MKHISHFQSDAQTYSNLYIHKPLRVKPLEISCTTDAIASDSDEVHLVADEFGHAEELGFRQCDLPKSEEIECPDEFESSNSDCCCTE